MLRSTACCLRQAGRDAYKCCKALEYAQHQGDPSRHQAANILLKGEDDIKISISVLQPAAA